MATNIKKAVVLSRELANRLTVRFGMSPSRLVREGVDTNGNPTIAIDDGTPAAGEQNVFVRLMPQPSIGLNAVGLAQDSYTPHVIQIAMEATLADAAVSLLREVHKLRLLGEALRFGPRVELYLSANGTAPDVSTLVAANLVAVFTDLYFPFTNDV